MNDKNSDVKLLQKALSTDIEMYPEQIKDGILGKDTERAIRIFQQENFYGVVCKSGQRLARKRQTIEKFWIRCQLE